MEHSLALAVAQPGPLPGATRAMSGVSLHLEVMRLHGEELPELLRTVDTIRVASSIQSATAEGFRRGRTRAKTTMTQFTIVIEDASTNFAAYAPDVPGCIATGATIEEVTSTLRGAIDEHLEILREMGEEIPVPRSRADIIRITS